MGKEERTISGSPPLISTYQQRATYTSLNLYRTHIKQLTSQEILCRYFTDTLAPSCIKEVLFLPQKGGIKIWGH